MAQEEVIAGCGHSVPLTNAGLCKHCGEYICADRGGDGWDAGEPDTCAQDSETCGTCALQRYIR